MTDEPSEGVRSPEQDETGDPTSTTGATGTERGEHVGRIAGSDPGYAGETGAERRSDAPRDDAGDAGGNSAE
jgi:hypothetical protein